MPATRRQPRRSAGYERRAEKRSAFRRPAAECATLPPYVGAVAGTSAATSPAPRLPARHDPGAILRRAVLAHLPLALEARQRDGEADNALQHALHEIGGCIGNRPGRGTPAFLLLGQAGDDVEQSVGVVEEFDWTGGVDRHVVPGWDHLAVLAFGGVPGGGDVGVRSLKDGKGLADGAARLRVGSRQMADQGAVRCRLGGEQQGNVAGDQAVPGESDQRCQPGRSDGVVQDVETVFVEQGRSVHAMPPGVRSVGPMPHNGLIGQAQRRGNDQSKCRAAG